MIGVGDEVQCINDDDPLQSAPPFVIKGRTYTVDRIETKMWPIGQMGPFTIMEEITFIWVVGLPSETGHYGFRFRKIEKKSEEKKTDISVFKKLLDKIMENANGPKLCASKTAP